MNLMAGARWLLSLASRRAARRSGADPADMGTAFGLDAITTLEPQESSLEPGAREPAIARSRFEHRQHRRSSF